MAIETIDDILEEIADQLDIYGTPRAVYVSSLRDRLTDAFDVQRRLFDQDFDERVRKLIRDEQRHSK